MGTQLILGLVAVLQASQATPALQTAPVTTSIRVVASPIATARCDAKPYQRLVGRTVSDLLTARLPANTRIYRLDDPQAAPVQAGRLSVELNRSTRVRRVYCS